MRRAKQLFIYGQLCFYVGLLICVIVKPQGLTIDNGFSYYGILGATIFPYCFALLGSAYFCWLSARELTRKTWLIYYALRAASILLVGIAITPYTAGRISTNLHETFGGVLFSLQLILSGWFVFRLRFELLTTTLTLLEFAAGIASLIYLAPKHGYLLESQTIFQLFFAALFITALPSIIAIDEDYHAPTRK